MSPSFTIPPIDGRADGGRSYPQKSFPQLDVGACWMTTVLGWPTFE